MWVRVEGLPPAGCGGRSAHFAEDLVIDDTGERVGWILQFYKGSPYYGGSNKGRTGPRRTLEVCRTAVESLVFGVRDEK